MLYVNCVFADLSKFADSLIRGFKQMCICAFVYKRIMYLENDLLIVSFMCELHSVQKFDLMLEIAIHMFKWLIKYLLTFLRCLGVY